MKDEMLRMFWYWINERHRIYLKYKVYGEEWPWTDDPIFRKYKFCNVFRELDTVTNWIRENWREPYADHPRLFFNMCVARQFNWPPTLEFIGFSKYDDVVGETADKHIWDADQIAKDLTYYREHEADNGKIFTGAYMLTGTIRDKDGNTLPKIDQIVRYVLDPIWKNEEAYAPRPGDTLEEAWERLRQANGFGPFLAYEVITDLRHTRYLRHATDIMTWANPGPGAMRGINRLLGLSAEPNQQLDRDEYIDHMRTLCERIRLDDVLEPHVPVKSIEMREVEHSLCEFDKYCRVLTGEGRIRSRFTPPADR